MSVVVVLAGLPGSGKSFLANNSELKEVAFRYSTDDYIEQMAIENNSTYTETFEHYIREATDFMNVELKKAIDLGRPVIWDQTNTKSSKRQWILSQFPEHYVKICFAIVPPRNDREWQLLIARIFSRPGKAIPKYVMDSMFDSYEEPTAEEGFNLINIISMNNTILKQIKA